MSPLARRRAPLAAGDGRPPPGISKLRSTLVGSACREAYGSIGHLTVGCVSEFLGDVPSRGVGCLRPDPRPFSINRRADPVRASFGARSGAHRPEQSLEGWRARGWHRFGVKAELDQIALRSDCSHRHEGSAGVARPWAGLLCTGSPAVPNSTCHRSRPSAQCGGPTEFRTVVERSSARAAERRDVGVGGIPPPPLRQGAVPEVPPPATEAQRRRAPARIGPGIAPQTEHVHVY